MNWGKKLCDRLPRHSSISWMYQAWLKGHIALAYHQKETIMLYHLLSINYEESIKI